MSDDRRGISLRKKKNTNVRPQISAPRPVPEDINGSTPQINGSYETLPLTRTETSQSSLRGRPSFQGQDRTADLVKRRYSTRFVGYPNDNGLAPPVPSMPSLPAQFQRQASSSPQRDDRAQSVGKNLKLDVKALRDPNLVPEQCKSGP